MNLKLIMALVSDEKTDAILDAARVAGATGATVITSGRGQGLKPETTFLGLDLATHRDVLMFLVVEPKARDILETISRVGCFDEEPGSGIAFQLSIDDAVGLKSQTKALQEEIKEEL
jgi:nitrogen regulatory protein PII